MEPRREQEMNPEMNLDAVDRILAAEEELIPSSGFLTAVMERVKEEAAAPPPIPFPWKRAIPGMALAAGVLGWGGFELARSSMVAMREARFAPPHLTVAVEHALLPAAWVALALGASLLSWLFSRRLAGRSGLL
jgi:hypothetical protein